MSLFYLKIGPEGIRIRTSAALVLVNKTYDEVLVERVAPEPEEYILGPDGEKIVAEPPVFRQAQEPEAPDSRSAEMVEALSGRTPEKNGLVEYIEKTAGGNGNGTPALRQAQGPAGAATGASAPSTSSGTTGAATGATVENMGGVLRAWMNMEGMSQAHLSVKSGVNEASVSRHIRNLDPIGPRALEKYARVFGVSVKEFLAKPAEEKPEPDPGVVTVLKKWLLMSGKSQADIRHALGVSSGELSNQVSGKNGLSSRRQEEYAKFFGVSVEEFLRGPGASTSRSDQEKQSEGRRGKRHKRPKGQGQAPAGGDGKSGNNEEAPVRNKRGSRQPKEEPEVLDPMVVAVCEACRENVGDVECGKCLITKGLQKARVQETPGQITHNVKLAVCAGCTHNAGEKCRTCRMGMYWAAVEYYNQGKGITEAAREAESDYQAELAAKT